MPQCKDQPTKVRLYPALACLAAVVTAARTAPLGYGGKRLQRQCVSEDRYLMLTIARNIALGHGFSVSEETVATNGTQPLAALVFAHNYQLLLHDRERNLPLPRRKPGRLPRGESRDANPNRAAIPGSGP